MHAVSHSLAHRAPPATRRGARWQPYNTNSARSSPITYLHTPASSVVSASPTPPQALNLCEDDQRITALTPRTPRDSPPRDCQKNRYIVGLVGEFLGFPT